MNASLRVEDLRVLFRSTKAKPDASNGMDQRIILIAIDFAANAADIHIDDVGRRVKMQVPYVMQKHSARDHLTGVASQVSE
jgi:hypothetical protein